MTTDLTVQKGANEIQTSEDKFWAVVDKWFDSLVKVKHRKPRTLKVYRYNLGVFKAWLDAEGIREVSRQNIKDWVGVMDSKGWTPSTKNLYLATIRSLYTWLANEHGLPNIAKGISGWECSREHKRGTLSTDDMKNLLECVPEVTKKRIEEARAKVEAAKVKAQKKGKVFNGGWLAHYEKNARLQGLRDKAILAALMAGGLRTIEITRLRVEDLVQNGGVCFLNVLGKGRDEAELVKISRKAERVIRAWLDARESVDVVSNDSPLFCSLANNSFGEALTSLSISRLVKQYLKEAGLKNKEYKSRDDGKIKVKPIVAHSLRASLATQAHLKGATLEQIKQQLRHRNLATSLLYIEEAEKFVNPCSDLVSDAIF